MTDSTDLPITSPDFLDETVLVPPKQTAKENEALAGNGNESAASQSFERSLLWALLRFKAGDFTARLPGELTGLEGKIADAFNEILNVSERRAIETARVCRVVGREGKLKERMRVPGAVGGWADEIESLNTLIGDLVWPTTEVTRAVGAVAKGDLSQAMALEVDGRPLEGEFLRSAQLVNKMIDQLSVFTSEVTRVAREVGTEGKLGGQAQVPGVAGTWKDLTDSVNAMASNLTGQVRNIAEVTTAVARGDLSRKITVDVKGEILALKNTINTMVDQLNAFASEVSRVVREVGTEGKLGGQAQVGHVAGTWKDLTGNVNLLAANLTSQVRAIAEVATAVTKGDLTRSIQIEARGEVAELKDNLNTMIDNLRATTDRNQEQDWLKTNLAKFTRILQGQRDLVTVGKLLLSELAPLVGAQQGTVFQMEPSDPGEVGETTPGPKMLRLLAAYAQRPDQPARIPLGIGLVGQVAAEKQRILLADVPSGYTTIHSSLGAAPPKSIVVLPVLFEGETMAVIELASLKPFTNTHLQFLDQLTQSIGVVLNTIAATMRTENLLRQSQELTAELQTRQFELQQTNEELALQAKQLAEQSEVARRNKEVEHARRALEEKAAELELISKYKSEFLANMSHELRTPLNSILILGQQLAENGGGNLTPKQIDFARNIHSAGTDLLTLINDILDLSKIESGTVTVEPEEITFDSIRDTVHRNFHHIAENKNLNFEVDIDPTLPRSFTSDPKRLQQILKNLLSNAFKFTAQGFVSMSVRRVTSGWSPDHSLLGDADAAVAFMVTDTGIGIAPEKQKLIFEAFQQADAGTSRKYGGTGLGLAISRELANLLGGEIRLVSKPGQGSKFTLYLPLQYIGAPPEVTAPAPQGPATGMAMPVPTVASSEERLRTVAKSIVAEDVQSPERLLDETSLFMDRVITDLPEAKRTMIEKLNGSSEALRGRKVLVIDDDARNIFALTPILENQDMEVLTAKNGRQAIEMIRTTPELSVVLMDIMMPEMDGYETMREIRKDPRFRTLPILALTAKAMKGDREKCLEAGASDYIAKPVNTDQLLSLLRVWLHR